MCKFNNSYIYISLVNYLFYKLYLIHNMYYIINNIYLVSIFYLEEDLLSHFYKDASIDSNSNNWKCLPLHRKCKFQIRNFYFHNRFLFGIL